MKHKLKKKLPIAVAVVVSGTILGNSLLGLTSAKKKDSSFSPSASISSTADESIIKTGLNKAFEIKMQALFNILSKKYLAKNEINNSSITCDFSMDNSLENNTVTLTFKKVYNGDELFQLLQEFSDVCPDFTLDIDVSTFTKLSENKIDFIDSLKITADDEYVGFANLQNFSNLRALALNTVSVINMPQTLERISFKSKGNTQYRINRELEVIKDLENVEYLSFDNLKMDDLWINQKDRVFLSFNLCLGTIRVHINDIDELCIKNIERNNNCVIINGKINNFIKAESTNGSIYRENILGNPTINSKITYKDQTYYDLKDLDFQRERTIN